MIQLTVSHGSACWRASDATLGRATTVSRCRPAFVCPGCSRSQRGRTAAPPLLLRPIHQPGRPVVLPANRAEPCSSTRSRHRDDARRRMARTRWRHTPAVGNAGVVRRHCVRVANVMKEIRSSDRQDPPWQLPWQKLPFAGAPSGLNDHQSLSHLLGVATTACIHLRHATDVRLRLLGGIHLPTPPQNSRAPTERPTPKPYARRHHTEPEGAR
jgi:hypothetical protein